ncbi:MAG: GAF domain-containing protein, partial [Longimicrobiales bacterium]
MDEMRDTTNDGAGADSGKLTGISFERYMDHLPAAFAVTRGADHTLIYANDAFRRLTAQEGEMALDRPFTDAFRGTARYGLNDVLDRALRGGRVIRDHRINPVDNLGSALRCSVWPGLGGDGQAHGLVIEVRPATPPEQTNDLLHEITERMTLSALREHDAALTAASASERATYLASHGRRLAESLDEKATLDAIARTSLPRIAAWCIVDIIDDDNSSLHRLAMVHPEPARQALLSELDDRWPPAKEDPFGVPAALVNPGPTVINDDIDAAVQAGTRDPETLRILREVGIGPLLTVPLVIRDRVAGAITFVRGQGDPTYEAHDIALAEDLAVRCGVALDSARLHGEALILREKAEAANRAKSAFLG